MRLLPLLVCAVIVEAVSVAGQNITVTTESPRTTANATADLSSPTPRSLQFTTPVTRAGAANVTRTPTPPRRKPDPATKVIRRLEKIDIDLLLMNKRIMTCYIRCFVGKGPCTPESRDFKKLLPRIIATGCGGCTSSQRKVIRKIFRYMYKERNSDWKMLQLRFDPKCKFENRVMSFMGVDMKKSFNQITTAGT